MSKCSHKTDLAGNILSPHVNNETQKDSNKPGLLDFGLIVMMLTVFGVVVVFV